MLPAPKADLESGTIVERLVDLLDVLERIVEEELDFGHALQLVADTLAQGAAHEPVVMLQLLHELLAALEGKDADVDLGIAEVGRDAHGGDGDQHAADDGGTLLLEDLGHVLLYLLGDFLLTGIFHG